MQISELGKGRMDLILKINQNDVCKNPHCARKVVLKASRNHILVGRHPEVIPNFPTSVATLADQRDALRSTDPSNRLIQGRGSLRNWQMNTSERNGRNTWISAALELEQ